MSDSIQEAKLLLSQLKQRLIAGEIDEGAYDRLRGKVLADLSPEELAAFGTGTPSPRPATPHPVTPSTLGPSGASGRGLRTSIPSLADLDLQPGSVLLGQWRLVRELGRGGFGAVFEAEELHLHEKQAVKVLDPAMVAKEELIARFRREVSLMRKLVHPRIVRVYDYREDLSQLVALISMELVTGGSVKQLLTTARAKNVEIPIPLALEILRQTLEALAEAHSDGVIHRDVTPGNVLLAGGSPEELLSNSNLDPKVKLVDFGIAGLVERSELSQKSRVMGTAAYVAPEVLDPSVAVTPAADVYGAGAMGYELLTGKLPLGRFRAPSAHRKEISESNSELVLQLLETEARSRGSAAAGARRLGQVFAESAAPAQSGANEAGTGPRQSRGSRRLVKRPEPNLTEPHAAKGAGLAFDAPYAEPARPEASSKPDRVARRACSRHWLDEETGLAWAGRDNGSGIEWAQARDFCEALEIEGRAGWRLPSPTELSQLWLSVLSERASRQPPIRLTGRWLWTDEPPLSGDCVALNVDSGSLEYLPAIASEETRVVAVRRIERESPLKNKPEG